MQVAIITECNSDERRTVTEVRRLDPPPPDPPRMLPHSTIIMKSRFRLSAAAAAAIPAALTPPIDPILLARFGLFERLPRMEVLIMALGPKFDPDALGMLLRGCPCPEVLSVCKRSRNRWTSFEECSR